MPTTTTDQPQGPGLAEAAKAFEGLLDREDGTQDTDDAAATVAPADTDEGVADAEAEAQETASQEDGAEDQAADDEEKPDQAEAEEPTLVTVMIDGKAQSIPLEEALKGYQRHSDYSRKTADLANQRRELEEHSTAVKDERQTYTTMLAALRDQLQASQEAEPNWDEVWKADPVGYARRRDEFRDKQDKIAAANFELQRLNTLQQKEQAENLAKMVQKGREHMLELNPVWKDQKVWDADRQKLVSYAQSVGYSPEEISQAYDPRAIVMMDKARRWDELQANRPKPVPAKGPRPASAGAAPAAGAASKLNAAQQRLARSGSIKDAAKVFEQLI